MRTLFFLLLVLGSVTAKAEKIEVFSTTYSHGTPHVTMAYVANRPLGRAWLNIVVDTSMPDSSLGYDEYEQKVEGLRYDEATKRIVIERDGQIKECARFKKGGFFGLDRWVSTGCRLSYKLVKRPVDDGFRIRNYDYVVVYLTIKE